MSRDDGLEGAADRNGSDETRRVGDISKDAGRRWSLGVFAGCHWGWESGGGFVLSRIKEREMVNDSVGGVQEENQKGGLKGSESWEMVQV